MKELLKNKWAWAVLILVVINIVTIGALCCSMCGRGKNMGCHRGEMCQHGGHENGCCEGKHEHGHDHSGDHHRGGDALSGDLNLTEDQKASFETLRKEHFEKMKVNFDSMQTLKKILLQSLGKTDAEANATIQKIGALEIDIQKETFDHFNKMYALCTDSQKVQLKEKLENRIGYCGPGFMHKAHGEDTCHAEKGGQKSCCSMPKRF